MKITSSTEYGMRLLVCLGKSFDRNPLTAEHLSARENVPRGFVDQILLKLRRARIVKSVRGSTGGYLLAKLPSEITVGEVLRALDGVVFEEVCGKYSLGEKSCGHGSTECLLSPVWTGLSRVTSDFLDRVTLSQILNHCVSTDAPAKPAPALNPFTAFHAH
ncbi:MAG: hypothetical protein A3G41_00855 [Elusimicrobia bacterium RIFCSPLOWO2_12_FULL_59_9]|nr:MAG: hypothetical protein A3G41_00855 [Elusimicrobia bacterium RIFCSPLOWO2_12_FULL_59_9]